MSSEEGMERDMAVAHPAIRMGHLALLRLSQALMAVAVALLALMAVLVVLQVVARNGFDLGLPRADELARFSSLALVYLSLPLLAIRGQHVAVDLLPQLVGEGLRRMMHAISEIGVLTFCGLTLYGLYSYLIRAGKFSTPALGLSNWLFYTPAVLGMSLLLLAALLRLYRIFSGRPLQENTVGIPS